MVYLYSCYITVGLLVCLGVSYGDSGWLLGALNGFCAMYLCSHTGGSIIANSSSTVSQAVLSVVLMLVL